MRLVRGGEDTYLELKVKLSNPEKIAQEIVALANTGGGIIVFGVNDQMRVEGVDDAEAVQDELVRICREEIQPPLVPFIDRIAFDNGRRVVALDVEGKRRPYRTSDGRYYLRIGSEKREASREELSALLDDARPLRFENAPAVGATSKDIDEAHLWSFIRWFEGETSEQANAAGYPTEEVLERDLLLATQWAGEIVPTVAGLLLFGHDASVAELLQRSAVSVTRFAGDSVQAPVIEHVKLTGNLLTLYEGIMTFLTRYCDLWETRPRNLAAVAVADGPVQPRANYHRASVTEAVSNLLVHRDLGLREPATRIQIFDRSLELINARRTNGFTPLVQKAIRYGIPQRLNPQLQAIFINRAYGLELASGGLPMLFRESRLFSGRRSEVAAFNDEFRLRMFAA
jgi:ATP-dependent DNA helicase RecG